MQNWIYSNSSYLKLKEKVPKYELLFFEDLIANPSEIVKQVLRYNDYMCNSHIEKQVESLAFKVDQNKSNDFFSNWKAWEKKYIFYLYKHCDALMKEFGYGFEQEWQEMVEQAQHTSEFDKVSIH